MDDKLSVLDRKDAADGDAMGASGHLGAGSPRGGVVVVVVRELGLVEKIDRRLAVTDRAKVSMEQWVLALILNGMGFSRDRL